MIQPYWILRSLHTCGPPLCLLGLPLADTITALPWSMLCLSLQDQVCSLDCPGLKDVTPYWNWVNSSGFFCTARRTKVMEELGWQGMCLNFLWFSVTWCSLLLHWLYLKILLCEDLLSWLPDLSLNFDDSFINDVRLTFPTKTIFRV